MILNKLTKPSCRECRFAQQKLYLKGSRCYSDSCAIERSRPSTLKRPVFKSLYAKQNREKRILKSIYMVTDSLLKNYVQKVLKLRLKSNSLYDILESRLDSVVYNCGIVDSRKQAQQVILHGKIRVNDRVVDRKNYLLSANDVISWDGERIEKVLPSFCELDKVHNRIRIATTPASGEGIKKLFSAQLVVEFISKNI